MNDINKKLDTIINLLKRIVEMNKIANITISNGNYDISKLNPLGSENVLPTAWNSSYSKANLQDEL